MLARRSQDEIEQAEGPFTLTDWDRETGEHVEGPIERIDMARGLADRRRLREDEGRSLSGVRPPCPGARRETPER
jgi:hypothetical protein